MKMEESLRELLDLSIDSPDGGISYVNFKALRQLLHCIVQRLSTDIETADGGKAHEDRDVDESLLEEEKSSESPEQQDAELGEVPSGTELSLSISDTAREEGVSKCMSQIQGLLKKNQELKAVTNNLKKEMETLKNQFSQVHDSEPLVMGPKSSELGGELDKSAETASQSRDSIGGSEQQHDLQTADLRNAVQQLYKAVQNVKQDMQELRMEQRETPEKKMQDKELKDSVTGTGLSDTSEKINVPPTSRDSSTAVSGEALSQISSGFDQYQETPASLQDLGHLQEMHKGLKARVEHLEGEREHILEQVNQLKTQLVKTIMADINKVYETEPLAQGPERSKLSEELDQTAVTAIQSKDSISGTMPTADHGNAVQQLYKEVQNMKQELLALRMEQKRTSEKEKQDKELKDSVTGTRISDTSEKINVPPTSRDSSTAVSDEAPSQISSGFDQYQETPASLQDVGHLQEMHKGLKARVEHLEGEKENIQDQVNQLKTQLVEMVMADTKKISEMECLVISPESSGLGGELDKSVETAVQSKDITSGADQQHDLQIADLRNAVQQLYKAVQNVKQELQALRIEQKRTSEKETKSKELKDSIIGTGLSDTSAKINIPPTSKDSSTAVSGKAPSQISSGVQPYTETPSAQPDVGNLQEMHKSLKSRVEHLEGERKHILEQVNQLKTQMIEIVLADTKKVYQTEPQVMGPESPELGGELDKSSETAIQSKDGTSGTEQQHDRQTANLRNAVQQLYKEVQSVKQELQALRMEQKITFEKGTQDRTAELTSDMQEAIRKLQAEFEKLHSTSSLQMKSDMQEQTHIDHLYKAMKELEEKAEEEMKIAKGIKADMHTLETTVSATTQQLNRMYQDLLSNTTGLEENYHTVTKKIFRELKLNHTGIDNLQNQIVNLQKAQSAESDNAAILKKQILTRFHCLSCDRPVNIKTPGPHIPVVPAMPSFPLRHHRKTMQSTILGQSERSPTEMSMKQTREGDSCDFNGQVHKEYQNTTDVKTVEMRLTTVPPKEGTSSFKKDKQWIPEDSVPQTRQQVPSVPPAKENLNVPGPLKEGYCEYNVNHNQLPASVGRKFRQMSPYRQQHSETDLICIGTSCFKKEKQWIHEDSLPRT